MSNTPKILRDRFFDVSFSVKKTAPSRSTETARRVSTLGGFHLPGIPRTLHLAGHQGSRFHFYDKPTVRPRDRKTAIAAAISRFLENRCFHPFLSGGSLGRLSKRYSGRLIAA